MYSLFMLGSSVQSAPGGGLRICSPNDAPWWRLLQPTVRPLSFSCSVNQPIELFQCSIMPQVVRGVWPLLRLWPYPTTPFPPPQPGHTPLACRGSRRPGGGREGRLVRRGVVEREREASLFHALLVQWTAHVLGAD